MHVFLFSFFLSVKMTVMHQPALCLLTARRTTTNTDTVENHMNPTVSEALNDWNGTDLFTDMIVWRLFLFIFSFGR